MVLKKNNNFVPISVKISIVFLCKPWFLIRPITNWMVGFARVHGPY